MASSATMTMTYTMRQRPEITSTGSLGVLRLEPSPYYREALPVKHKSERDFLRWQQSKRMKTSHKPTTTFQDLPCEIVSLILGYLPPFEVWRLRSVSRGFSNACLGHPTSFKKLDLSAWLLSHILFQSDLYSIFPKLPTSILGYLLPACQDLKLSHVLLDGKHLEDFFSNTAFSRLKALDLSFCLTLTEEMLCQLAGQGVKLERLILKGCSRIHDGKALADATPHLKYLDLSWSGVRSLPSSRKWPNLQSLNLSACDHLSRDSLQTFLATSLPTKLTELNLSSIAPHILSLETLYHLRPPCTLHSVDLSRLDQLTKQDVRLLTERWSRFARVEIKHTALLETDDREGWRAFISLLAHAEVVQ